MHSGVQLPDACEQRVYLRIVLAGIALAVEVYWVMPEKDIAHGAVEAAVFLLKAPMPAANFGFGLHGSH